MRPPARPDPSARPYGLGARPAGRRRRLRPGRRRPRGRSSRPTASSWRCRRTRAGRARRCGWTSTSAARRLRDRAPGRAAIARRQLPPAVLGQGAERDRRAGAGQRPRVQARRPVGRECVVAQPPPLRVPGRVDRAHEPPAPRLVRVGPARRQPRPTRSASSRSSSRPTRAARARSGSTTSRSRRSPRSCPTPARRPQRPRPARPRSTERRRRRGAARPATPSRSTSGRSASSAASPWTGRRRAAPRRTRSPTRSRRRPTARRGRRAGRSTAGAAAGGRSRCPRRSARYVRLRLSAPGTLTAFDVVPLDATATTTATMETMAAAAPRGRYPEAFLHRQTYWTITGADAAANEALVGETRRRRAAQGRVLGRAVPLHRRRAAVVGGRRTRQRRRSWTATCPSRPSRGTTATWR